MPTVPTEADRMNAKAALPLLKLVVFPDKVWEFELEDADGKAQPINIPAMASSLFLEALSHVAAGRAISLAALEEEVTTQQAAAILKVSRPFVVALVEKGELSARQVGNRLRLPLQDVLNYKAANGPKRRGPQASAPRSE